MREMCDRCEIAIDQAGHELVDEPVPVDIPGDIGILGGIKGDLQSIDDDGYRYCYYVRTSKDAALPGWLANLAPAAHQISNTKVYLVAPETSSSLS